MTNVGWNLVLFRAATFKYIFKYGEKKSRPKKFKYGLFNFCDRGEEKACPSQIQMEIIETKPELLDWSRHKTYGKGRKHSPIFWSFGDHISPNMKQFEKNFKKLLWRVFSNDRPEQENTEEKWLCEQIWISSSSSRLYWLTSESSQRRSPKRWVGGPVVAVVVLVLVIVVVVAGWGDSTVVVLLVVGGPTAWLVLRALIGSHSSFLSSRWSSPGLAMCLSSSVFPSPMFSYLGIDI